MPGRSGRALVVGRQTRGVTISLRNQQRHSPSGLGLFICV